MKINLFRWTGLLLIMLYSTAQAVQTPTTIASQMYYNGKSPAYIVNTLVLKHKVELLVAIKITTKVVSKNTKGKKLHEKLVNMTVAATFLAPDMTPEIITVILQNAPVNKLPSNFPIDIILAAIIVVPEISREIIKAMITAKSSPNSPSNIQSDTNKQATSEYLRIILFKNGFYSGEKFSVEWNRGRIKKDLIKLELKVDRAVSPN